MSVTFERVDKHFGSDFAEVVDRWLTYQEKERREMELIWETVPKDSLLDFLRMCAKAALLKLSQDNDECAYARSHWTSLSNKFADCIQEQMYDLKRICTASPEEIERVIQLRDELTRLEGIKREWRKSVSDELKSARAKKNKAVRDVASLRQTLKQVSYCVSYYTRGIATQHGFPAVPKPFIEFDGNGSGLPQESGVYFAWCEGIVEYVGQSINLNSRCKESHHKLRKGDRLSFVLIPREELNFAESFYIGILKPRRNFGNRYGREDRK